MFLVFMFGYIGCALFESTKKNDTIKEEILISPTQYMSHKDIVKQFNTKNEKSRSNDVLGNEALAREKELFPLDKVIDKATQERIDRRKKLKENEKSNDVAAYEEHKGKDLRFRDTPIKQQWNGTCTAFGLIGVMENLLNQPLTLNLSERDLWSIYRAYSSNKAVGAAMSRAICFEEQWPQTNVNPYSSCKNNRKTQLLSYSYLEDNIKKSLEYLDMDFPVYLAMSTPKDMLKCKKVMNPYGGVSSGGHAIGIVGYKIDSSVKGGGYYIIRNSWGSGCADNGYQYMPFHYCERSDMYCVMWAITGVKGSNTPVPPLPAFDINKIEIDFSYYKKWYQWYKRLKFRLKGDDQHLRQIKSVTYKLIGETTYKATSTNLNNRFYRLIKTRKKYTSVYTIIKDNKNVEYTKIFKIKY